ncbi:MAG: phosphatase PAP2 family protein [Nitrospirota bacterium]
MIKIITHGTTMIITAFVLYICGRLLNQRIYEVGKSLIIGFVSSGIVVQILKHLIGRARPRLTDNLVFMGPSLKSGYDSFPSGHTAVVFCLAYILSQHFSKYRIVFYSFAILAAFSRILGLSHFFSDILAGAILGLIVGKMLSVKIFLSDKSTKWQR